MRRPVVRTRRCVIQSLRYPARSPNQIKPALWHGEACCRQCPEGIRFLLGSGKPIQEPLAWYGPIVMNTQDQLRQAHRIDHLISHRRTPRRIIVAGICPIC
ncbi:MAG TPA: pirin-like C-terminal cupin domain-containing protein [Bryobacteraceae bacterium]